MGNLGLRITESSACTNKCSTIDTHKCSNIHSLNVVHPLIIHLNDWVLEITFTDTLHEGQIPLSGIPNKIDKLIMCSFHHPLLYCATYQEAYHPL